MSDTQLAEVKTVLAETNSKRDALATEHSEYLAKISENQSSISDFKTNIENLELENKQHHAKTVELAKQHNALNSIIAEAETKIAEHETEVSIQQHMSSQPTFYNVMQKRLTRMQEDLRDASSSEFIDFVKPCEVVKTIEELITNPSHDSARWKLAEGANVYSKMVRDMATKKHQGQAITIEDNKQIIDYIDRWLMLPHVNNYWRI